MHGEEKRKKAVQLRQQGCSVPQIAHELAIARSTAYQWTKNVPREGTAEAAQRRKEHSKHMTDARWAEHRVARDLEQAALRSEEAFSVGGLSEREVMLLGAAIYWCEGTKSKPWRQVWRVQFTNSDPGLVRLFLRFVGLLGYPREELSYRVSIHESADVEGAKRWWEEQADLPVGLLTAVTLKRHEASPGRYNTGDDYHGCLVIAVPQSSRLYWRMEGIMMGLVADCSCDPVRG
jgi:hypothetical protein